MHAWVYMSVLAYLTTTTSHAHVYPVCNASICAHGDNNLDVSVSYDGGNTYEEVASTNGWAETTEVDLTAFSAPATLRFLVDDSDHTGGFLATVRMECDDGTEQTWITDDGNTMFDVVYALSGDVVMDEFWEFGGGGTGWMNYVNEDTVECMDTSAYWMWNGVDTDNVMFELELLATALTTAHTLTPADHDVEGIEISLEDSIVTENSDHWYLALDSNTDDWAIKMDLSGDFQFSSSASSISVEIDGSKVASECDMFFGIGDGSKYISYLFDFDSALWGPNTQDVGIWSYPACGGALGVGDINSILHNSSDFDSSAWWCNRDALAGGDRLNWGMFSSSFNGDTWPVTLTIKNDVEADEVIFTHSSSSLETSCTFSGAFATDTDLTVGMLPDVGGETNDDIKLTSITVAKTVIPSGSVAPCDYESDDDISVVFGAAAAVSASECKWYLGTDAKMVDDWALGLELTGDYQFGSGISTVSVEFEGECVTSECDMFWGFGDGNKWLTVFHDFESVGGANAMADDVQNGFWVYPPCGGPLADGDIESVLAGSTSSDDYPWNVVRDQMAAGNRSNWHYLNSNLNGDTWPVTVEVTNFVGGDSSTFRFLSDSLEEECQFTNAFQGETDLFVAIQPDLQNGTHDDILVHSLTVDKNVVPTSFPTTSPSPAPSVDPTVSPTKEPTANPTMNPTPVPTVNPTPGPTDNPTKSPTEKPTANPTMDPTPAPTDHPSSAPTAEDYETWTANAQCHVNAIEYDGDRVDNPLFEDTYLDGTYTLAECMEQCESSVDSHGRSCVAVEYADGGIEVSADTVMLCALAWGCDYTGYLSGGSVFMRKAHYVAHGNSNTDAYFGNAPDSYCQRDSDDQAAYDSTLFDGDIGVGCCSIDGSNGYRPDCNAHPATYDEAEALCTSTAGRLCTLQEMLSLITKGEGCDYDRAYQWTSDHCHYTETHTRSPSPAPTENPTKSPSPAPTVSPTRSPTPSPTDNPTKAPTSVCEGYVADCADEYASICSTYYSSAHTASYPMVDVNALETGPWTMELTVKDLLFMLSVVINVLMLTALCYKRLGGEYRKYQPVRFDTETETEMEAL